MTFPRRVWLFTLLLGLLTTLPYALACLNTPSGWAYSGAPLFEGVHVDYNSHLAKMQQGYRGQFAYQLLFTPEPHPGVVGVQGFYVALGALARLTPLSLPLTYHLAKFILTVIMGLALWRAACHFFDAPRERWLLMWFATFVSGVSWLLLIINPAATAKISPVEFWLTDGYHLLGALYMPHFVAAVILQIVVVLTFDSWTRDGKLWRIGVLTLALAALSIIQPYVVLLFLPLLTILTAHQVFAAKRLPPVQALPLALPLGAHGALALYQYLALQTDPVWQNFVAQNQTLSPPGDYYLLGYLPFLIPMILGFRAFMLDKPNDKWWLPLLWVAIVAALVYAPLPTQRRYVLGLQTPLSALAAYGWARGVLPRIKPRLRGLLTGAYVLIAFLGIGVIFLGNFTRAFTPLAYKDACYSPDELAAFDWLRANVSRDDVTLTTARESGLGSGGRLVAATGQRVFIGHYYESTDFQVKRAQVRQLYDPATGDDWRRDFLRLYGIAYVWYDDYARAEGSWSPASAAYLKEVFVAGDVTIYEVRAED